MIEDLLEKFFDKFHSVFSNSTIGYVLERFNVCCIYEERRHLLLFFISLQSFQIVDIPTVPVERKYQQSSQKWKSVQWNSVNRPQAPPPPIVTNIVSSPVIGDLNRNSFEDPPTSNVVNSAKESHDKALLRLHQLTTQLHDLTVGNDPADHKQEVVNPQAKRDQRRPPTYKNKKKNPVKYKKKRPPRPARPPPKIKRPRKKISLGMPKAIRRVKDSAGETLDAVLALVVPGHEAGMRRRRNKKQRQSMISLDDSILTFAISSGIIAAILAA